MRVCDVMSSPAVVVATTTPVKRAAAMLDERGFTCLRKRSTDGQHWVGMDRNDPSPPVG